MHIVKIKSIQHVTHDVLQIRTTKPGDINYIPGQAVEISINKNNWQEEKRPFTFTSLPENNFLEFTIKTYPERRGVTNELLSLHKDDEFLLYDVFGDIHYKGEGIFIAGGAGVTPFISILRQLNSANKIGNNKLIFANKSQADIILKEEFQKMLGSNFINVLSDEKVEGFAHGYITESIISENSKGENSIYYLCGPPPMMDAVERQLQNLKINSGNIVKEAF